MAETWAADGRLTVSQLCDEIEEGIGVRFAFPCFSAAAPATGRAETA